MNERSASMNPGDRVAEFQVERLLALSQRSAVYLVADLNLGKRFVLKECLPADCVTRDSDGFLQPLPGCEDRLSASLAEFRSACRLQAGIENPNIPRILRYFESRGSACCLMEWQRGETLQAHVELTGAMTTERARVVIEALAGALAALHADDLLHLAVNPSNVYLGADGQVFLLDYLAAARFRSGQPVAPGADPWTAPELSADPPDPTPASDLFGLCSLAHFCLTGTPPISAQERQEAILAGQADPLPTVAGQQQINVFGGLADAVDLGLRMDPAKRPADVTAWRQAYESIDWRRRVVQDGPADETRERPEWLSPLLLGVLLAAVVVTAGFLLFGGDRVAAPEAASEPEQAASAPTIPAEETRQWQAALQADTVTGYRRFLETFPDSSYAGQARIQLDILDERVWKQRLAEDTLSAYQDYLDRFPTGIHQAEALRRIDRIEQTLSAEERARTERDRQDNAAWQAARDTATVAALDEYLQAWPSGRHADAARDLRTAIKNRELEARAWDAAVQLNTRDAYQAYLDAYPDGEHSAEALISMEHLDLAPGKAFRDCPGCPAMVVLPAGEFRQGSDTGDPLAATNEQPRRTVHIDEPFAIGIHEVTFDQWNACVAGGGCRHRPTDNDWGRGSRPVIMVSWNDAQEYVAWLSEVTRQNYRLPSESEWEYAARAGEESPWLGSAPAGICRFANIAGAETTFRWRIGECSDEQALGTWPVGSKAENAFGLHDVIGNVAEWTADCMNISYLDAPVDGSAWNRGICSSHMTRGGSWVTGAREVRLPARFPLDSGDRNDFTGFRVVRSVEE